MSHVNLILRSARRSKRRKREIFPPLQTSPRVLPLLLQRVNGWTGIRKAVLTEISDVFPLCLSEQVTKWQFPKLKSKNNYFVLIEVTLWKVSKDKTAYPWVRVSLPNPRKPDRHLWNRSRAPVFGQVDPNSDVDSITYQLRDLSKPCQLSLPQFLSLPHGNDGNLYPVYCESYSRGTDDEIPVHHLAGSKQLINASWNRVWMNGWLFSHNLLVLNIGSLVSSAWICLLQEGSPTLHI